MQSPMPSITPIEAKTIHGAISGASATNADWMFTSIQARRAARNAMSARYCFLKRLFDIFGSGLLLMVLFVPGLVIALLVKLTSPGEIFYREERIGRFGIPFRIYKFRTMYVQQADSICNIETGSHNHLLEMRTFLKHIGDPRVTPVGRVLRKWSLDEFPQLLNVFRGEMSLVGPRPIVEAERALYGEYMQYYTMVHPGMTGLWQISGRSNVSFTRRVQLDSLYCIHWSMASDLSIMAKTIPAVVKKTGAY